MSDAQASGADGPHRAVARLGTADKSSGPLSHPLGDGAKLSLVFVQAVALEWACGRSKKQLGVYQKDSVIRGDEQI